MAVSRLADRRVRAAATQAALRLDVRGPVSEALGRTGIVVSPADAEAATALAEADRQPAPARAAGRGLAPTVKPFDPAPWPTRPRAAEPAPLSGLTADERRVHRILIDSLAIVTAQGNGAATGLSYAETKSLEALDLAFIDDRLAAMERRDDLAGTVAQWAGALGAVGTLVAVAVLVATGAAADAIALTVGAGVMLMVLGSLPALAQGAAAGRPKRRIYEALRELAVLNDESATSDAVLRADALIDRLAADDLGEAPEAPPTRRRTRA